ncbi:MAG: hypothetical protein WCL08_00055 [Verrucomicrobiota bacterium]
MNTEKDTKTTPDEVAPKHPISTMTCEARFKLAGRATLVEAVAAWERFVWQLKSDLEQMQASTRLMESALKLDDDLRSKAKETPYWRLKRNERRKRK